MDLFIQDSATTYRSATTAEVMHGARTKMRARYRRGRTMGSPEDSFEYLFALLADKLSEVFVVLFMDNRQRLISTDEMFQGSISTATIHSRGVVQRALEHNAATVILAHNHPAGVAAPSQADINLTNRLKDALALIDVRVMDHIIIGGMERYSFAEHGFV